MSLHAYLSWRFCEAMAPALEDEELRYAALVLVDGRPVVLFGGDLDLFHYVFQARRQVGSVSKLFFYEAVWRLGAAKTGTTDGGRDAWFAGFLLPAQQSHQTTIRPRITFVVWAGYDDNRPAGLYGGHVHGPIFRRFLRETRVQAALRTLLQEKP